MHSLFLTVASWFVASSSLPLISVFGSHKGYVSGFNAGFWTWECPTCFGRCEYFLYELNIPGWNRLLKPRTSISVISINIQDRDFDLQGPRLEQHLSSSWSTLTLPLFPFTTKLWSHTYISPKWDIGISKIHLLRQELCTSYCREGIYLY